MKPFDLTSRRLLLIPVGLSYAFLYLPIFILVVFSFSKSRYSTVWGGFTFDWYQKLLNNDELLAATLRSLTVSSVATLIATALGTAAAYAIWRHQLSRKKLIEGTLLAPIVVPEIVQGIGLLIFFSLFLQIQMGLGTIIIAHSVFCLAYVTSLVQTRLHGMTPTLLEAALNLGATPSRAFWRILFPLIWPGILSGGLLAFTISFDDFVVTFFVSGPDGTTLPLAIYSMVKRGVTPEINALATLVLGFSITMIALSLFLQRQSNTRKL